MKKRRLYESGAAARQREASAFAKSPHEIKVAFLVKLTALQQPVAISASSF